MSEFFGNLTADLAILDGPEPAESDSSVTTTKSTDQPDGEAPIQNQSAENESQSSTEVEQKPLSGNSRPSPTSQNPQQEATPQSATATRDGLMEFCKQEITEALPQWMAAHEKEKLISQVNAGIFKNILADKPFMASLNKSYDRTQQSLQRGAELLFERWLEDLPGAIRNLNLPRPLTQDDADSMDDLEILSSSRHGQPRPARSPLRGVVK